MIMVIKKRVLITTIAVVLCTTLVLGLVISQIMQFQTNKNQIRTDAQQTVYRGKILIDAGHGGPDGGVSGAVTKTKESDINLAIALLLKSTFEAGGYTVVMTRETENGLCEKGEKWNKKTDMQMRKTTIQSDSFSCIISIHCNKFPSKSRRGVQVFYDKFSPEGMAFAGAIQSNLNTLNQREIHKVFSALNGDYFILKCSNSPSIIIECGFLSNESDEILLLSENYRAELVNSIYIGTDKYLLSSTTP